VNRIDRSSAKDRLIPVPAVDGRGLEIGDLEQLLAARLAGRRRGAHCRAEGGAR
jgi:hypothetical protein